MPRLGGSVWSSTDVLRVAVEDEGFVGFIEVGSSTTLAEARQKICTEIEGLASVTQSNFTFLLPDSVPISRKQEQHILARELLPIVQVRMKGTSQKKVSKQSGEEIESKDSFSRYKVSQLGQHFHHMASGTRTTPELIGSKVSVSFLGEEYSVWITKDYTFAQLRREAARYWSLHPEHVVLMDDEGCSWPEAALVSSVVEMGILKEKQIVLVRKPGVQATHQPATDLEHFEIGSPRSPCSSIITINNLMQNNIANGNRSNSPRERHDNVFSTSPHATSKSSKRVPATNNRICSGLSCNPVASKSFTTGSVSGVSGRDTALISPTKSFASFSRSNGAPNNPPSSRSFTQQTRMPDDVSTSNAFTSSAQTSDNAIMERYVQLWRIYTFYCVQIDSLKPFSMDRRGFIGLLHDCQLVDNGKFCPAILNLVFASNCKNSSHSNKLGFDNFLDALLEITRRLYESSTKRTDNKKPPSSKQLMPLFCQLLAQRILPSAATWNIQKWERQAYLTRDDSVLQLLKAFARPLFEIFRFYAPAVENNRLDVEEDLHFSFHDLSTFAIDFQLAELGIRPQLAEIFLAAAQFIGVPISSKKEGLKIRTRADLASIRIRQAKTRAANAAAAVATFSPRHAQQGSNGRNETETETEVDCSDQDERKARSDDESEEENETVVQPPQVALHDPFPDAEAIAEADAEDAEYLNRLEKEQIPTVRIQNKDGSPIWDRPALSFAQFLDALLRVAYAAFPHHASDDKPDLAFKALLQHFCKCLRRSQVIKLLEKRKELSTYPFGLMNGTSNLYKTFLAIWKKENQPDYASMTFLGGKDNLDGGLDYPGSPKSPSMRVNTSSPSSPSGMSAYRKKASSSSSFSQRHKDRSSPAGSGRKVLEQLLRAEKTHNDPQGDSGKGSGQEAGRAVAALLGLERGQQKTPLNGFSHGEEDIARFGLFNHLDGGFSMEEETGENLVGHSLYEFSPHHQGDTEKYSPGARSPDYFSDGSMRQEESQDLEIYSSAVVDSDDELEEKTGDDMSCQGGLSDGSAVFQSNEFSNIESSDKEFRIQSSEIAGRVSRELHSLLCKGGVFLKHCRRGPAHPRYVWCNESLTKIYWCPFNKRPDPKDSGKNKKIKAKSISVVNLQDVVAGFQTNVMRKDFLTQQRGRSSSVSSTLSGRWNPFRKRRSSSQASHEDLELKETLCFSILSSTRTLDLESDSPEQRNMWLAAFRQLAAAANPRTQPIPSSI